jgi:hypothetical protein
MHNERPDPTPPYGLGRIPASTVMSNKVFIRRIGEMMRDLKLRGSSNAN